MSMSSHKTIIILAALLVSLIAIVGIATSFPNKQNYLQVNAQKPEKTMTAGQLKKYDGTDPSLPIYLAMEGLIYDVSEGKKFYAPGGSYHDLAGKDSTLLLKIAGGNIIKEKYPVVGRLVN